MRKLICWLQILLIINIAVAQATFTNFEDTPDSDSIFKALEDGQLTASDVLAELDREGTAVDANDILNRMIAARGTYGDAVDNYFDALADVSTRADPFRAYIGLDNLTMDHRIDYNKNSKTLTNLDAQASLLISQFSSADEIQSTEDGWLINGDRLGGNIRKEGFRKFTSTQDGVETFIDCERSVSGSCEGVYRDGKFYIKGENVILVPRGDLEIVGNGQDYYVVLDPAVFTNEQGLPVPLQVKGGNTNILGNKVQVTGSWNGIAKTAGENVEYNIECNECFIPPVSSFTFGNELNTLNVFGLPQTKVTMGTPVKGYKFYLEEGSKSFSFDGSDADVKFGPGDANTPKFNQITTNQLDIETYARLPTTFDINGKQINIFNPGTVPILPSAERPTLFYNQVVDRMLETGDLQRAQEQIELLHPSMQVYYYTLLKGELERRQAAGETVTGDLTTVNNELELLKGNPQLALTVPLVLGVVGVTLAVGGAIKGLSQYIHRNDPAKVGKRAIEVVEKTPTWAKNYVFVPKSGAEIDPDTGELEEDMIEVKPSQIGWEIQNKGMIDEDKSILFIHGQFLAGGDQTLVFVSASGDPVISDETERSVYRSEADVDPVKVKVKQEGWFGQSEGYLMRNLKGDRYYIIREQDIETITKTQCVAPGGQLTNFVPHTFIPGEPGDAGSWRDIELVGVGGCTTD